MKTWGIWNFFLPLGVGRTGKYLYGFDFEWRYMISHFNVWPALSIGVDTSNRRFHFIELSWLWFAF